MQTYVFHFLFFFNFFSFLTQSPNVVLVGLDLAPQVGLKLRGPTASVSKVVGFKGMHHHAKPVSLTIQMELLYCVTIFTLVFKETPFYKSGT